MIEQLIHRIKIRQAEIQLALAQGTAGNWDTYQRMVGEWQGLEKTLTIIDQMLEEPNED
jgi:hypothetical protein